MTTQTSTAPISRAGRYFLAPASDSSDCYSAGYEGNVFDTAEEAAKDITELSAEAAGRLVDGVVAGVQAAQLVEDVARQIGMRPEDYLKSRGQVAIRQQIVDFLPDKRSYDLITLFNLTT